MIDPSSVSAIEPLLEVSALKMYFPLQRRGLSARMRRQDPELLKAVDDVSFTIGRGESVGLVGESGCGKTTLGRCIVGLYQPTSGEVRVDGVAVGAGSTATDGATRAQIIFQDPYSSLNPRMTVGQTLTEAMRVHGTVPRDGLQRRCLELLDHVRLSRTTAGAYPRQLSGGQRQRVSIARALAVEPELLVADEPVSSLDVSVQATVLNLLAELRRELGLTLLLIAHNMAVVRHVCERAMVMYLGRVVETGQTEQLLSDPRHPYTRALLSSVPRLVPDREPGPPALSGDPPSPINLPLGCRFNPRCPIAQDVCAVEDPRLETGGEPGHAAACHFAWS